MVFIEFGRRPDRESPPRTAARFPLAGKPSGVPGKPSVPFPTAIARIFRKQPEDQELLPVADREDLPPFPTALPCAPNLEPEKSMAPCFFVKRSFRDQL